MYPDRDAMTFLKQRQPKVMATEDGPMLAKDECRKVCGGGRLWSRQRCNG